MKKFFREFKAFISRGNVIDLAVGVIIGSAFTAIVTALTQHVLMPVINWFLLKITGGKGLTEIYTYLEKVFEEDGVTIDLVKSIYIDWGAFITAIINFILIALVVFCIVKAINKAKDTADVDKKMIPIVQDKLNKDEALTAMEARWLARYNKKNADKPLKKEEPKVEEPVVVEPTKTEALLEQILKELKAQKK